MAQRHKQPLISSLLIIGASVLLFAVHFPSDLYSPALFILKAGLQPLTVTILAISLCFALVVKKKLVIASAFLALLISTPFLLPYFELSSAQNQRANSSKFTIATFSTLTRTENVNDILVFIKSEKPDLLCLQEVSEPDRASLLNELSGFYSYHVQNKNNQITLSHHPLKAVDSYGGYQKSVLNHPEWGELNVINAHMPRPYLSKGISGVWKKLINTIDDDSRIVLCGDLNTTPNNSLYDLLRYRYNMDDALTFGYGFTYPNSQRTSSLLGPFIRIDYLLTRGMRAVNTRTVNASNLSDHRAVIGDFTIEE